MLKIKRQIGYCSLHTKLRMIIFPGEGCKATASRYWEKKDVDYRDLLNTKGYWNAGAHSYTGSPQWVEIDLGAEYAISFITLIVSQLPDGHTHHIISGRTENGDTTIISVINKETVNAERIEIQVEPILTRYIKIETKESPSWIAWDGITIGNHSSQKVKSARK